MTRQRAGAQRVRRTRGPCVAGARRCRAARPAPGARRRRTMDAGDVAQTGVPHHGAGAGSSSATASAAPRVCDIARCRCSTTAAGAAAGARRKARTAAAVAAAGQRAVAEPVADQHLAPAVDRRGRRTRRRRPSSPVIGPAEPAAQAGAGASAGQTCAASTVPLPGRGVAVEPGRLAGDRAQADAERAGGGVPVARRRGQVGHARARSRRRRAPRRRRRRCGPARTSSRPSSACLTRLLASSAATMASVGEPAARAGRPGRRGVRRRGGPR